jgi:hypothetical protein
MKDTTNICGESTTKTQEDVNLKYQGYITEITEEEFQNLRESYVTFKEMFG